MTEGLAQLLRLAFADGAPRLGFGTGDLYAGIRAADSRRLIDTAFDSGFRYFDTARLYGDGSAEEVLGAALEGRRDKVVLASKVGILPWSMRLGRRLAGRAARIARKGGPLARAVVAEPPPAGALFGAYRPEQLRRSLETSLKALRTDYLDILLLHECAVSDALSPQTEAFLSRARQEGKLRYAGIATSPEATAEIVAAQPSFLDVVQGPSQALGRLSAAGRLLVTHSPLKALLPRIVAHAKADAAFARCFAETTGTDPRDAEAVAALLLARALRENAGGIVLFSTLKPARAAAAQKAVAAAAANPDRLSGLDAMLRDLDSPETLSVTA